MRLLYPVKGAAIKAIAPNVFIIMFNHTLDHTKAIRGCPWALDRHALILEPIDPTTKPENQELIHLPIIVWVSHLSISNRLEQIQGSLAIVWEGLWRFRRRQTISIPRIITSRSWWTSQSPFSVAKSSKVSREKNNGYHAVAYGWLPT